jgi:hypothetical protein
MRRQSRTRPAGGMPARGGQRPCERRVDPKDEAMQRRLAEARACVRGGRAACWPPASPPPAPRPPRLLGPQDAAVHSQSARNVADLGGRAAAGVGAQGTRLGRGRRGGRGGGAGCARDPLEAPGPPREAPPASRSFRPPPPLSAPHARRCRRWRRTGAGGGGQGLCAQSWGKGAGRRVGGRRGAGQLLRRGPRQRRPQAGAAPTSRSSSSVSARRGPVRSHHTESTALSSSTFNQGAGEGWGWGQG